MDDGRRHSDARAATHGMEEHVHEGRVAFVPALQAVDTYIDLASDFHSVISVSKYSMIFICLLSSRRPRRRATRPIHSN
jgi:hypothetical protein